MDKSDSAKTVVYVAGGAVALYLLWPLLKGLGGVVASTAGLISDVEGKAKTVIDETWKYAVVTPWHYGAEGASKVKQAANWTYDHTLGYIF